VIAAYTDAKRVFVTRLRQPRYWYLLNRGGSFGDYAKQQGLYPADLNFHIVEQAAFDVVDTCAAIFSLVWLSVTLRQRLGGDS
jgi:hypothetical protein